MTVPQTYPDPLWDLRTWLRAHPLLASLTGDRVFFRVPVTAPAAPFIRLYQVGGGPLPTDAPTMAVRASHEVWGTVDADYQKVTQTCQALESLYRYAQSVLMGAGTILQNAHVTGVVDAPDPDTGAPRRVVDVLLTVSL